MISQIAFLCRSEHANNKSFCFKSIPNSEENEELTKNVQFRITMPWTMETRKSYIKNMQITMAVLRTTNEDFANQSAAPNQEHRNMTHVISNQDGILEKTIIDTQITTAW